MTTLVLHTFIKAPIERVFDLSRNIDFHIKSASQTHERAVAGTTTGLIGLNETVTWKGNHFGLNLKHTSKIVQYSNPVSFTDMMIDGHFTYFIHKHLFYKKDNGTQMIDVLKYKTPFGFFGRLFNYFFLKVYLYKFLSTRNKAIKVEAEKSPFQLKEAYFK